MIARNSSFVYKGRTVHLRSVGGKARRGARVVRWAATRGRVPLACLRAAPTKRKPRWVMVRISLWSSPLSPIAFPAALMRLVKVDSENDPTVPDGGDQIVLTDDPVTVPNQINQQVEHLRLDGNERRPPIQLATIGINAVIGKREVAHWRPRTGSEAVLKE